MIVVIFVVVAVMQLSYKGVGSWAAGEAMASPLLSLEHRTHAQYISPASFFDNNT